MAYRTKYFLAPFLRMAGAMACGFVLVACSASVQGAPLRPFEADREIEFLASRTGPVRWEEYHEAAAPQRLRIRNSVVLGRLYAIDLAYGDFEKRLTQERQHLPFAVDATSIALSLAGARTVSADAANLLAAIDSGLKGGSKAYGRDILANRTIDLLQESMRANRNLLRGQILERLASPDHEYPLELALADVERYFNAGTITSGLIGITDSAAERLRSSENPEAGPAIIFQHGADEATAELREYWRVHGPVAAQAMRDWLDSNGLEISLTALLNARRHAGHRIALRAHLGL